MNNHSTYIIDNNLWKYQYNNTRNIPRKQFKNYQHNNYTYNNNYLHNNNYPHNNNYLHNNNYSHNNNYPCNNNYRYDNNYPYKNNYLHDNNIKNNNGKNELGLDEIKKQDSYYYAKHIIWIYQNATIEVIILIYRKNGHK